MAVDNTFLFNFAASYSDGGYKRLHEFARWFDKHGGARFIIHPNCGHLQAEFRCNQFFIVEQSRISRLFDDCGYLRALLVEVGRPDFYYSYGIPLYARTGSVNWFHLSNVLPLQPTAIPISFADRLKHGYLGRRIRRGFQFADVISAESKSSLSLIGTGGDRLFLSVNGSDDELEWLDRRDTGAALPPSEDVAVIVGTYRYKGLDDALRVFEMLRSTNDRLELMVFGNAAWMPKGFGANSGVVVRGRVDRPTLMACLRGAKYYISTTYIENSYNAASEGVFCAAESYISDIGPHRELLAGAPFTRVRIASIDRDLLRVSRDDVTGEHLKRWDTVVRDTILRFQAELAQQRSLAAS